MREGAGDRGCYDVIRGHLKYAPTCVDGRAWIIPCPSISAPPKPSALNLVQIEFTLIFREVLPPLNYLPFYGWQYVIMRPRVLNILHTTDPAAKFEIVLSRSRALGHASRGECGE